MATRITSTTLDREMSDILNRVAYRGESFVIERNGREVALLSPVSPLSGTTLREIAEKLRGLEFPAGFADSLEASKDQIASLPVPELPEWPE